MSKKVSESVTYDKRNHRKTTYKKYRDVNGRKITTIKSRKTASSSLVGGCFIISLCLILGTFFFNGYFNIAITNTEVNEVIENDINDTTYQIQYVDYDYTHKLEQLSGLKNVFTVYDLESIARSNLYEPGKSGDVINDYPRILGLLATGDLEIKTYSFIDIEGQERSVNYLYWAPIFAPVILVSPGLADELDDFVNKRNYKDYVNLVYGVDMETTPIDKVYSYMYRFFTFMNAPLDWLYNFVYDLGVLIAFIVNW